MHEPSILFLDEPTSGVDPIARRRFWDQISEMSAAGTTIFVSTHYMEEAEYCHRLALLNRGRLIALDSPRELKTRSIDRILGVETSDAPKAVAALREVSHVVEAAMFGRSIHVTVDDLEAGRGSVRSALASAGIDVRSIAPVDASLEDVFTSLVRAEGGAVIG